jgi:hypothetical protein
MDYELRIVVEKVAVSSQEVVKRDTITSYALHLLSAPLTIPLVCCHSKSFQRASRCGVAMARRRKEERRDCAARGSM